MLTSNLVSSIDSDLIDIAVIPEISLPGPKC
jgi:hypothetical protein